jgi:hypothetical protein
VYRIDATFYPTSPARAILLLALEAQAATGLFQQFNQGQEVIQRGLFLGAYSTKTLFGPTNVKVTDKTTYCNE